MVAQEIRWEMRLVQTTAKTASFWKPALIKLPLLDFSLEFFFLTSLFLNRRGKVAFLNKRKNMIMRKIKLSKRQEVRFCFFFFPRIWNRKDEQHVVEICVWTCISVSFRGLGSCWLDVCASFTQQLPLNHVICLADRREPFLFNILNRYLNFISLLHFRQNVRRYAH